jgi:hypothetical protein
MVGELEVQLMTGGTKKAYHGPVRSSFLYRHTECSYTEKTVQGHWPVIVATDNISTYLETPIALYSELRIRTFGEPMLS